MPSPFSSELESLIGKYNIPPGTDGSAAQDLVDNLLDDAGKAQLYDGVDSPESLIARKEFIGHIRAIHDQIEAFSGDTAERNANPEKYALKFEELFKSSPETKALYHKAVLEEKNSTAFRNAVFLKSCKKYGDRKWTEKLALWIPGPSGAGKTYSATEILKMIDKDLSGGNSDDPVTPGGANDIVFVDGDVDRKVSQMRQLVLKVALKKGYPGITDLHEETDVAIKQKIMDAACDSKTDLHLCVPSTFNVKYRPSWKNRSNWRLFDSVEAGYFDELDSKGFKQVMCEISAQPEFEKRFRQNVKTFGRTRAYLDDDEIFQEHADTEITFDNESVGCESKKHGGGKSYKVGGFLANRVKDRFRSAVPEGVIIDIANDAIRLVIVKVNLKDRYGDNRTDDDGNELLIERLELADKYQKSDLIMSSDEYDHWLVQEGQVGPRMPPKIWLNAQRKSNPLGPYIINQEGLIGTPFPGFTKVPKDPKKKDGGAQVKAEYTDFYTDEHGQRYFIKKTGNADYTGDDIAEILTARIGRKLLGSDARLIAECEPIRAVNGDVYVKSKCAPNWKVLHKHTGLGKNFTGAAKHHTARKSADSGDTRRKVYDGLSADEKQELAKSLAICLVLMEYDCNTENIGTSDSGVVKIDHGWGLVNILKDKHKKVRLYNFKGLIGHRGGNLRATPTNHFLDYPDILSGREFIKSIDEVYTEFLSKGVEGKEELHDEVTKSIEAILKERGSVHNQRETLLYLLNHIDFKPKCFEGVSLNEMSKDIHNLDVAMVVEEIATEVTKQIELRMHSMNIYKHTLDYQSIKEIVSSSDTENKDIDIFNIVRKSIHGIYETLQRIESLEGHKINIQEYISFDCGSVLGDMLSDLQRITSTLDKDGEHIDELMEMLPELKYIKERSQHSGKFKDKFTRPILSIVKPIEDQAILDAFEGGAHIKRRRDPLEDEEAANALITHKKQKVESLEDHHVPVLGRYSAEHGGEHDSEKRNKQHKAAPVYGAKARASLPEAYDIDTLKSSIQRSNKHITFKRKENASHVITEKVLVRNKEKARITYDPSREISTEIESATTHPDNDELKIFADCIKVSGCREPKFDRGNITDLIKVLEYLKREGYECDPEITTRMMNKAQPKQQVILLELCDDLAHITQDIDHPHKRQKIEPGRNHTDLDR